MVNEVFTIAKEVAKEQKGKLLAAFWGPGFVPFIGTALASLVFLFYFFRKGKEGEDGRIKKNEGFGS